MFIPESGERLYIQIAESPVHAGFPSPAEDYGGQRLDLNKHLIKNPSSTFFARVSGESMINDGVEDGDLLVVDKAVEPFNNCLAICCLNGEFTLKRVIFEQNKIVLQPANDKFSPIIVDKDNEFIIWGIVRYIIKKV